MDKEKNNRHIVPSDSEEIISDTDKDSEELSENERAFLEKLKNDGGKKYGRFVIAALGSIPWIGGVLGALAGYSAEKDQEKINEL